MVVERSRGSAHYALLVVALAAPMVVLAARFLAPDGRGYGTHEQLGLAPCAVREGLGVPCPACGVTTSVALAARGELGAALATQPFGVLLALGAPFVAVLAVWVHLRGRDLRRLVVEGRGAPAVAAVLGIALVAAWIYKAWALSRGS